MPQSLAKILIHTVFSTKERLQLLQGKSLQNDIHGYLGGICKKLNCLPISIGGVEDHVHILSTLSRTCEQANFVKELKRGSSIWIKSLDRKLKNFAWQSGYGAFSIGFSQIKSVQEYIQNQELHHMKMSFKEEFRLLLKKYEIDFDERYVWD